MPLFERYWSQAADVTMVALRVVEEFNVIKYVPTDFFLDAAVLLTNPLPFESWKKLSVTALSQQLLR